MELVHDFVVPVPPDQAWQVLTDVERIAPCLPGASVTMTDGDTFEGGMKIKLGPIGMTFKGQGSFVEKDAGKHLAVIEAKGRDSRGNGGAQAHVTASLADAGGSTAVHVVTDLAVSGKAAQFGTGVLKDVSNKLLDQFVANLAAQLQSAGAPVPASPQRAPGSSQQALASPLPARASSPQTPAVQSLDVASLVTGSETVRRAARTAGLVLAGIAFGYLWGKNRVLERQVRRG